MFAAPEAFEMSLAGLALLVFMGQGSINRDLKQPFPAEAPIDGRFRYLPTDGFLYPFGLISLAVWSIFGLEIDTFLDR